VSFIPRYVSDSAIARPRRSYGIVSVEFPAGAEILLLVAEEPPTPPYSKDLRLLSVLKLLGSDTESTPAPNDPR
jgi:hypothetical protein